MSTTPTINYHPSRTVSRFLRDASPVKAIMGPVGSGKSVGCVVNVYQLVRAFDALGLDSRWALVRNSYRELEDSTLSTYMDWLRPYGSWSQSTMTHTMQLHRKHEVRFRALDKPQDMGKLLSTEYSGGWLNECRELPRAVFDLIQTRIGRYPRRETWGDDEPPFSLLLDTNPPDDFHWFHKVFVEDKPDDWAFYRQGSGLEPDAENIQHLRPNYYQNLCKGKDEAWVKVYVEGEFGFAVDGKPVYPMFRESRHVAPCEPFDAPVTVGMDFGLTPAAVFLQQTSTGQWQRQHELVTEDTAADEFGPLVKAMLERHYHGARVSLYGDPAGSQRSQADKSTPFKILRAQGLNVQPAKAGPKANDFDLRTKAVTDQLSRNDMAAEPVWVCDPRCRYLIRAMAGGYKYRQLQVSGDERFHVEPDKNIYSHVAEADQYAAVGAGAAMEYLAGSRDEPIKYDRLNRRRSHAH